MTNIIADIRSWVFEWMKTAVKRSRLLDRNLGYFVEFTSYLSYPFRKRKTPDTKFVIYGPGRSGSTLLVSLLNSEGVVYCDNELFHRKIIFPLLYLSTRSRLGNCKTYGFKLLNYQLRTCLNLSSIQQKKSFISSLTDNGYKIIYLKRSDVVRQALSNIYARHNNQYHSNQSIASKNESKLNVKLNELESWIKALTNEANHEAEILDGFNFLELSYEHDLQLKESHASTISKLSQFLNIELGNARTSLEKITPTDFSCFIENASEVEQYLKQNGYNTPDLK